MSFISEIWSSAFITCLQKTGTYSNLLTSDCIGRIWRVGELVKPAISDQPMVVNQYTPFEVQISCLDAAQDNEKTVESIMQRTAWTVAANIDKFVAAEMFKVKVTPLMEDSQWPLSVDNASDAYNILVSMACDFHTRNVPVPGRWVVVPPRFLRLLMEDPRFESVFPSSRSHNTYVGNAAGFRVYYSEHAPAKSAQYDLAVVAGHPSAGTFVSELLSLKPTHRHNNADCLLGGIAYDVQISNPSALEVKRIAFLPSSKSMQNQSWLY